MKNRKFMMSILINGIKKKGVLKIIKRKKISRKSPCWLWD